VLAPGLIGGSLLRALRAKVPGTRLSAWARRPEAVAELRHEPGLVDLASTEVNEAIAGADCLVLAMPTVHMAATVAAMKAFPAGSEVIVTDVGSVKAPVVREVGPLVRERGGIFIGSHPMAGSEKKGLAHAEAGLFEGAAVVLTPEEGDLPHLPRLEHFWKTLGGVVTCLAPDRHDDLVAGISHLPHLVAAALARSVLSWEPGAVSLSGGGFRDTTRVAGGPEEMWADILSDNREAVSRRLAAYLDELRTWKDALDALDRDRLRDLLCEARRLRGTVPARTSSPSPDPAT
jgi:prephenate dehydrogenase